MHALLTFWQCVDVSKFSRVVIFLFSGKSAFSEKQRFSKGRHLYPLSPKSHALKSPSLQEVISLSHRIWQERSSKGRKAITLGPMDLQPRVPWYRPLLIYSIRNPCAQSRWISIAFATSNHCLLTPAIQPPLYCLNNFCFFSQQ